MLRRRFHGSYRKNFINALPGELLQQAFQPAGHFSYVRVVTNSRLERSSRDSGLIFVDFPWMKIKNAGPPVVPHDPSHIPYRHSVGQQAKESTAAAGPIAAK